MNRETLAQATELSGLVAELLERLAAREQDAHRHSDIRYAEALARTLVDQLVALQRSSAA